ncbi:GAF domain-containing protein [Kribbella aluminosa]|uniref:GAF domain-containing protein n=1 Tax=Kribbella aluminosa TaxID=416017 RepID=A0ABS4UKB0_9ACTN|nr:GAF and ANTAR domain-containing protein [Kribbella aluminosa]MBP2352069.1 GAF domain-containing protein [Kribbella aluminosa]
MLGSDPDVASAFARLAVELHSVSGIDETADAVAVFALSAVGCRYVAIELARAGGGAEIVAATDPVVERILQWQLTIGDGPMLHALSTGVAVHVADPATDTRWPLWSRFVADLPVGSVLHVPLTTGEPLGVLSLYHAKPQGFTLDDEAIAEILARHTAIAVATARHTTALVDQMDARRLIGQAMGILMERFGLNGDQAYAILRRYSQETRTKLRDVALEVVNTRNR